MEQQSAGPSELEDLMASYGKAMIRIQQLEQEMAELRGSAPFESGDHREGAFTISQLQASQDQLKVQTDLNTTLRVHVNRLNSELEQAVGPAMSKGPDRPRRRSRGKSHSWWKFWQKAGKRRSRQSQKG